MLLSSRQVPQQCRLLQVTCQVKKLAAFTCIVTSGSSFFRLLAPRKHHASWQGLQARSLLRNPNKPNPGVGPGRCREQRSPTWRRRNRTAGQRLGGGTRLTLWATPQPTMVIKVWLSNGKRDLFAENNNTIGNYCTPIKLFLIEINMLNA